jgi:hypothetical protein
MVAGENYTERNNAMINDHEIWERVKRSVVVDSCGGMHDDRGYFTLSGTGLGMDAEEEIEVGTRRFFRKVYWVDNLESFRMVPVVTAGGTAA